MRAAAFDAVVIEGHKGLRVVLVPFDPEDLWAQKPVRLAGRRHGWPVSASVGGVRFLGYIGERWGRFFVTLENSPKASVGDTVAVKLTPTRTAAALAIAVEQSKSTTQPKKPRADAVERAA